MNNISYNTFHFIHPQWLWALLPVAALAIYLWRRRGGAGNEWTAYVDAHLLQYLAVPGTGRTHRPWWFAAGLLAALATVLALAGPAWQRVNMPTFTSNVPTVMVLSLAQSMNSDDLKPSRLKRAEHKIRDLLRATAGDSRGLVIYADTAFVAAPLTNDANIIKQLLPELSTTLMPVLGNRLDVAINAAVGLLKRGQAARGRIVVLADDAGDNPPQAQKAAEKAQAAGYTLSVIGVGTAEGANLQTADGRRIMHNGQVLHSALASKDLQQVASSGGGVFVTLVAGDSDVQKVLADNQKMGADNSDANDEKHEAEGWQNQGYWLLLIPVLVLPWFFRRGVLLLVVMMLGAGLWQPPVAMAQTTTAATPEPTQAKAGTAGNWWQDLWQTRNQQGQHAFDAAQYNKAAARFDNPDWQAAADYKAGNYQQASAKYQAAGQHYNAGNALAKAGDLKAALAAYEAALKADPNDKNAAFNRDIVKKMLEDQQQNEQQQNEQQQNEQQQNEQQQNEQQQNEQQQNEQQQNEQQQNEQQQNEQQQNEQQQNEQQQNEQQQNEQQQNEQQQNEQQQNEQQQSEQQQSEQQQSEQQQSEQQQSEQQQSEQQQNEQQQSEQQQSEQQQSDPQQSDPQQSDQQQSDQQQSDQQQHDMDKAALPQWQNEAKSNKETTQDQVPVNVPAPALDQATEQQLRRVPDDPSGLLRHRIKQHYWRQQMGQ